MNLAELLEQQAVALPPDERRKLGAKLRVANDSAVQAFPVAAHGVGLAFPSECPLGDAKTPLGDAKRDLTFAALRARSRLGV
jgi:hypothetical protein